MRFKWLLILVPLVAIIVTACSQVSAEVLDTETPLAQFMPQVENESGQTQGGKPDDISIILDYESTASAKPEPTATSVPADNPGALCADPFEGANVRFSPSGWKTNFCTHSVPYDEFFSGGPPRDGIPPIDVPNFETLESADAWLEDREPVVAVELNGDARAYPLQILIWHEIVNDTVGDVPVVVTFCPLCNTALVFERPEVDGELLTFGTSGNLRNSDLVMWDRQTESWWQQFTGEALVGNLTSTRLDFLPASILSWVDFKDKFQAGRVLSRDTGFTRSYGRNPYAGYDNVNQFPFLFDGQVDNRLLPMTRVLGFEFAGQAKAYVYDRLQVDLVINDTLGEIPVVAFWKAGTASAVDTSSIPDGRDVGTTGVFLRTVDDTILTFRAEPDGNFVDEETGSTWDILGEAIDGPLSGRFLTAIPHHDTFWFAWAAFVPDGALVE